MTKNQIKQNPALFCLSTLLSIIVLSACSGGSSQKFASSPPADKDFRFSVMLLDRSFFDPYLTNANFTQFIFQHENAKGRDAERRALDLSKVYAFLNTSNTYADETRLKPLSTPQDLAEGKDMFFANLKLLRDSLIKLIPDNNNYKYLRLEPIRSSSSPKRDYVSYMIYLVRADEKTPAKNTGIHIDTQLLPQILNPSPPYE